MRRLEWSDLDDATREHAVASTIRICRVSRDQAEDLVASAVVRLMTIRPVVRNPKALLIEASVNLLRTQRRRRPEPRLLSVDTHDDDAAEASEPMDERTGHVEQLLEQELRDSWSSRVLTAIDQLKPADRSVLTEYYLQGRPLIAIDDDRGDRRGTAKLHVHRARSRLLRILRSPDPSVGIER